MTIAEAIHNFVDAIHFLVGALCSFLVVGAFVFMICVAVTEKWPWGK